MPFSVTPFQQGSEDPSKSKKVASMKANQAQRQTPISLRQAGDDDDSRPQQRDDDRDQQTGEADEDRERSERIKKLKDQQT
ncbi:MAG: hypothetical protein NVS9B15_03210 [Acidobacteriaceae bacterium]